jgi:hypothetical protein
LVDKFRIWDSELSAASLKYLIFKSSAAIWASEYVAIWEAVMAATCAGVGVLLADVPFPAPPPPHPINIAVTTKARMQEFRPGADILLRFILFLIYSVWRR